MIHLQLEQISLFDTVRDEDVLDELKSIDISVLTPIEAINVLNVLQNKLKNRW
jgi:DNA mismatch repair protein MutS